MENEITVPSVGGKWKAKIASMTPAGWTVVFLSIIVIGLVFAVVGQAKEMQHMRKMSTLPVCKEHCDFECWLEKYHAARGNQDAYEHYKKTGSWP